MIIHKRLCDVCGDEAVLAEVVRQVIFQTCQNDGSPITPRITHEKLDVCSHCDRKFTEDVLLAWGCQGNNKYKFKRTNRKTLNEEVTLHD
jgi:hypothetical protein